MVLTFYTILAKGLKLKFRKYLGLIPSFIEVTVEKLLGRTFCPPSWIELKYYYLKKWYLKWFSFCGWHKKQCKLRLWWFIFKKIEMYYFVIAIKWFFKNCGCIFSSIIFINVFVKIRWADILHIVLWQNWYFWTYWC